MLKSCAVTNRSLLSVGDNITAVLLVIMGLISVSVSRNCLLTTSIQEVKDAERINLPEEELELRLS